LAQAGDVALMIGVYVDDIIVAGQPTSVEDFKARLGSRFEFQSCGQLYYYLAV
jgi:hypothetical protein